MFAMNKFKFWVFGFAAVILVGLTGWLGVNRLRPHTFTGMVIQSPQPAQDFSLLSNNGQNVSLSDFRGKLVILYFGYTFCPDVCPATLSEVEKAMKLLGDKAGDVQVIMISVDPERDTLAKLGEYMAFFDPRFIGLTGEPDELAKIAALYGVYYEKHEGTPASGYLVDHTATLTVIDREGFVKLIFPFGTQGKDIAADLAYMLR
jgi:protein SCO1/2